MMIDRLTVAPLYQVPVIVSAGTALHDCQILALRVAPEPHLLKCYFTGGFAFCQDTSVHKKNTSFITTINVSRYIYNHCGNECRFGSFNQ